MMPVKNLIINELFSHFDHLHTVLHKKKLKQFDEDHFHVSNLRAKDKTARKIMNKTVTSCEEV